MTAEEFAAAGLDKLSAAELESLNRWLLRQVQEESSAAADQARANLARFRRGGKKDLSYEDQDRQAQRTAGV